MEEHQITDLSCKLKDLGNGKIAIPLKNEDESVCHIVDGLIVDSGLTCGYVIEKVNFNPPKTSVVSRNHQDEINFEGKKTKIPTPYQKLVTGVVKLLNNNAIDLTKTLEKDIPTHWEKHGHMVLLPGNCFTDDIWTKLGNYHNKMIFLLLIIHLCIFLYFFFSSTGPNGHDVLSLMSIIVFSFHLLYVNFQFSQFNNFLRNHSPKYKCTTFCTKIKRKFLLLDGP